MRSEKKGSTNCRSPPYLLTEWSHRHETFTVRYGMRTHYLLRLFTQSNLAKQCFLATNSSIRVLSRLLGTHQGCILLPCTIAGPGGSQKNLDEIIRYTSSTCNIHAFPSLAQKNFILDLCRWLISLSDPHKMINIPAFIRDIQ